MPTTEIERRDFQIEEIRVTKADDGARQISWYAAVFDSTTDIGPFRERLNRRAFTKTLADGADVRGLVNHDANFVLGRNKSGTLSLKVDVRGLHATVTPPDTQWARDFLVSVERGDISAGSFGFRMIKDAWTTDEDGVPLRTLQEAQLLDVSIVTYPAYNATDGTVALRTALAAIDLNVEDFTYTLLRSALAGADIKADELIRPLLRARAGQPLAPEERDRFRAIFERLSIAPPEPPTPDPAPEAAAEPAADAHPPTEDRGAGHSVRLAIRRRQLALLQLKGGR